MGLLDQAHSFAQGASNGVAGSLTGPVDGLAWLLRKAGVPVPQAPLGGSDWMRNVGLMQEPKERMAGLLGEGIGSALPTVIAGKAPQIAGGLLQIERNAMAPRTLNPQTGAVLADYRGQHTAPMKGEGSAPLNDLKGVYPDDIYSPNGPRYYGDSGGSPSDSRAVALMQQARGKPNMPVTMYRAVPYEKTAAEQAAKIDQQLKQYMSRGTVPRDAALSGSAWYENAERMRDKLLQLSQDQPARLAINNGDWVTLSKEYAKEHGQAALNGKYKIVSKKVPARKLFTDGNSVHEFGYDESGKAALGLLGALGVGALGAGYYLNDN